MDPGPGTTTQDWLSSRIIGSIAGGTVANMGRGWRPDIDRGQIVWEGGDQQIWFFDGTTVRQITSGGYNMLPTISSGNIAWTVDAGLWAKEILFYDGNTVRQLSADGSHPDFMTPHRIDLDGGQVAWQVFGSGDYGIAWFDGTNVTRLTTDIEGSIVPPQVDGGQVAWFKPGEGVFFYDGSTIRQLSTSPTVVRGWGMAPEVAIDNGQVAWSDADGVRLFDGAQVRALSSGQGPYGPPVIDDGQVAWVQSDGLYLFDGTQTSLITSEGGSELDLDNGQLVWSAWPEPNNPEIFLYNGVEVLRLSNNGNGVWDMHPQISNGQVVWTNGSEILLWTPPASPLPGAGSATTAAPTASVDLVSTSSNGQQSQSSLVLPAQPLPPALAQPTASSSSSGQRVLPPHPTSGGGGGMGQDDAVDQAIELFQGLDDELLNDLLTHLSSLTA